MSTSFFSTHNFIIFYLWRLHLHSSRHHNVVALPPHLRFTGLGRHIAVQLGIFREAIDERHERVADLHQAVSRLGVGDVFHLILRDVEKLR